MVSNRNILRLFLFSICVILVAYVLVYYQFKYNVQEKSSNYKRGVVKNNEIQSEIIIVSVVCGDRLHETLTMLKSAILFSFKSPLKLIIVAEDKLVDLLSYVLEEWQLVKDYTFSFEIKNLSFPLKNQNEWKSLFKPCASQRLFLPTLLQDIDSVLYVDTDTIFMAPLHIIWDLFKKFNSSQLAGLSPEHEDSNVGWYNRFAKHPYYGKLGVNSGVMLMNLTRMRQFHWSDYVLPIYKKYKLQLTWGDQDIINVIFHYHPDKLYVFSCLFNYRPDHCMYMSVCNPTMNNKSPEGIVVLHGNRGYFHSMKQPIFSAVYQAMFDYKFGSDPHKNFLRPIEKFIESNMTTGCGQIKNLLLTYCRMYIKVS